MPSLEELEEHEDSLQIAYEIAKMQVSTKNGNQNDPDESAAAGANLYRYSGFIDSYFEEGDDDNGENYDDIEIELEYTTVKRGKSTSKKVKSNKQVVSSSSSTSILPSKDYRGRYYYEKFKKGNH